MVNSVGRVRTRLSLEDRREQLVRVGVELIATQPWDGLTMSDIAVAAEVSKPLLYHYFSTKADLYIASVRAAAEQLQDATRPDASLPPRTRLLTALAAHVDWVEANALGYRAILQGGSSGHAEVHAIVEQSRSEVVRRIAESMGLPQPPASLRIVLRGWVGFLEAACLDWLAVKDLPKRDLVNLLAASLPNAIASVNPRIYAVGAQA